MSAGARGRPRIRGRALGARGSAGIGARPASALGRRRARSTGGGSDHEGKVGEHPLAEALVARDLHLVPMSTRV
ncbi:MAG: hypothetical protein ACRD0J_10470, partial [Acidimicrobiales bacterium]